MSTGLSSIDSPVNASRTKDRCISPDTNYDRDILSSSASPCIDGIETPATSSSDTVWRVTAINCALFAHKNTPTLSTWAVARKSFVGENAILVATLGVRNASIKLPVGTSNVRMIESSDVDTIQRESGENAWKSLTSGKIVSARKSVRCQEFVLASYMTIL